MPGIADRFHYIAAPHSFWIPSGRLVELTGGRDAASVTMAVAAVLQAQTDGDTAAWIQARHGGFFPPDLAESGVDLDALVVVQIPQNAGSFGIPKSAEMLLRSGAFGLVVLDLRAARPRGDAWLGRLLGLAREHDSRIVLITTVSADADSRCSSSLGSLVSLRIEPRRVRASRGVFAIEHEVLKDKLGSFSRLEREWRRGPWGLR